MNTKDIALVGVGIAFGYLLVGYLKKSKVNSTEASTTGSIDTTGVRADQAKIDKCNQAVADYMATAKFTAGTDIEAIKKAKFDSCMSATSV